MIEIKFHFPSFLQGVLLGIGFAHFPDYRLRKPTDIRRSSFCLNQLKDPWDCWVIDDVLDASGRRPSFFDFKTLERINFAYYILLCCPSMKGPVSISIDLLKIFEELQG